MLVYAMFQALFIYKIFFEEEQAYGKITLKKKVLTDKSFSVTLYQEEECGGGANLLCTCPETKCGTDHNCGICGIFC